MVFKIQLSVLNILINKYFFDKILQFYIMNNSNLSNNIYAFKCRLHSIKDTRSTLGGYIASNIVGPAPVYKLQTLVGYDGHCLSRQRGPAYTMRPRTDMRALGIGPGPRYNVAKLTNYGTDKAPAYTIAGREPFQIRDLGPGPGAHYPELCLPMNHNVRSPAYSIKSRAKARIDDTGPGPSAYSLPTCIGPKIPDKIAQGAFSIAGIHELRKEDIGPGPAAYTNMRSDLTKRSSPAYSLKWRYKLHEIDRSPGPQYYSEYEIGKRAPIYSFGIRHSECAGLPITSMDED